MQKELLILDDDKNWMRRRITELEKAIQDLGPEFYDALNQSSETWHDNAPFDALRDRQSVLAAELQSLRTGLRSSAISVVKPPKGRVGIGSTVVLSNKMTYFIAGDFTPYAGQIREGKRIISRQAPLAQLLFDKCCGDEVLVGRKSCTIIKIE